MVGERSQFLWGGGGGKGSTRGRGNGARYLK